MVAGGHGWCPSPDSIPFDLVQTALDSLEIEVLCRVSALPCTSVCRMSACLRAVVSHCDSQLSFGVHGHPLCCMGGISVWSKWSCAINPSCVRGCNMGNHPWLWSICERNP